MEKIKINSLEQMNEFALKLIPFLKKDTYLLLNGDLGAGKTTLTKMILKNLGVTEVVSSPTFVILNQYSIQNLNINHMDAYRLTKSDDPEEFEEQFSNSLNIIEWSENLDIDFQKLKTIIINISLDDETRTVELEGVEFNV
jgi:tRNA threonylcarbamoyladenosine biosynthesis protein TsaE